ncbi:MAG: RusA family crossover junction endodeoxyribonuclease [Thermoplasmata archaeon]
MITIIRIKYKIKSAKRPRLGKSGKFYSPSHKEITSLAWDFASQSKFVKYDKPVKVIIQLAKSLTAKNSDLDNLAKTIIDAIVQAKIIKDDNIQYIKHLTIEVVNSDTTIITITDNFD